MKRAKLRDLQIFGLSIDFQSMCFQVVDLCRCGRVLPYGGKCRLAG
jgi:hypothetical protein